MAEFTVAIELGSSKITGIAGRKNKDGSISILAVAQEDGEACIRKGVVRNIDKTVQALSNIIKKLEATLKTRIAHVYGLWRPVDHECEEHQCQGALHRRRGDPGDDQRAHGCQQEHAIS